MSIDKYNLDWSSVERALEEGTFSGYKMAVIETEKILRQVLENKKIPGKNPTKQIEYIKAFINFSQHLKVARACYQKIIDQPHFEINRDETKDTITAYYQVITDLMEAERQKLSLKNRLTMPARRIFHKTPKQIKKFGIYLALFCFLTLFLAKTSPGKQTGSFLVNLADFMVFRVFLALTIIGLMVLIILGMLYFKQKRK